MELLATLHRDLGKTVIMVTHDPGTARYADQTLRLEKGQLVDAPTDATGREVVGPPRADFAAEEAS